MSTALDRILDYKADEVAELKAEISFEDLHEKALAAPKPRGFASSLQAVVEVGENGLICELKRKSPSAGDILPGADPVAIAKQYEAGGAACLSVLTDFPSFGGTLADIASIKANVDLPVLRKDFMIDPIQVVEARAHSADAILVIMGAVSDALGAELCAAARTYGMDVLVEVHNEEELHRALPLSADLFGINNRDLTRMVTDLSVTEALSSLVPEERSLVSESGVKTPDDISRLRKAGARRFLIGESLMKEVDRTAAVKALRASR